MKKRTVVVLSALAVVLLTAALALFIPLHATIAAHLGIASVTKEDIVCLEIAKNDAGNLALWRTQDGMLIGEMIDFIQKRRLVKATARYAGEGYEIALTWKNKNGFECRTRFNLVPGSSEVSIPTDNDGRIEGRILIGGWSSERWTDFLNQCETVQPFTATLTYFETYEAEGAAVELAKGASLKTLFELTLEAGKNAESTSRPMECPRYAFEVRDEAGEVILSCEVDEGGVFCSRAVTGHGNHTLPEESTLYADLSAAFAAAAPRE